MVVSTIFQRFWGQHIPCPPISGVNLTTSPYYRWPERWWVRGTAQKWVIPLSFHDCRTYVQQYSHYNSMITVWISNIIYISLKQYDYGMIIHTIIRYNGDIVEHNGMFFVNFFVWFFLGDPQVTRLSIVSHGHPWLGWFGVSPCWKNFDNLPRILLVGGDWNHGILWLSRNSWECHNPDWRTHIFQRGWNHQLTYYGK